ncbi:TetR/AcrR family transcriptional regulator [Pediococcus ethanolidurans]|uniref:TetR/AcrR family transcriptional regulator n=1 Tax=Pediococcus ethanolidurans TaxID=319653 RepID=UPI0021E8AEDD|nr:TetR/AcrR family transcriptional regulator [Pediococcus ethanolidurans]MCV3315390.1 TetR/AcrR family transcriptional regulator [Pediococcus ethanolidurans]MCV3554658.1 TetR/AcrR family transcriptional regulator [Pediococcus ethanolidurans]
MNSNDLRAIKSKRDIEVAFIQLINQNGFSKITIKDICTSALIGRSTFYRYYEDKYDLLKKLITKYTQILDDLLTKRMNKIVNDDLLINLYLGLSQHKSSILCLLTVSVDNIALETSFKNVLVVHISDYLRALDFALPKPYIKQLYANNVMTAIVWSLQHGVNPKIANMMNEMFHYLIKKYAVKAAK